MRRPISTDRDVVNAAKRIDRLHQEVQEICWEIESGDHPNKERILEELLANEIPVMAWARHVVRCVLGDADGWETGDFGIRRRRRKTDKEPT
jgi:hypothetical protein